MSYTPTVGVPFILKRLRGFQNPFLSIFLKLEVIFIWSMLSLATKRHECVLEAVQAARLG